MAKLVKKRRQEVLYNYEFTEPEVRALFDALAHQVNMEASSVVRDRLLSIKQSLLAGLNAEV